MQLKDNTEKTEERKNRFNGESIMLTKEEARRHDNIFTMSSQLLQRTGKPAQMATAKSGRSAEGPGLVQAAQRRSLYGPT